MPEPRMVAHLFWTEMFLRLLRLKLIGYEPKIL
jgi:hypothetical protein